MDKQTKGLTKGQTSRHRDGQTDIKRTGKEMDRERQTDGEEDAGEHASPMSRCQSDRVTRSFSSWEMADRESEEH